MDFAERVVHCPKCGRHSAECFCTKYRLTPEGSAKLRSLYNDCLCEDCLRGYAV